MDKKIIIYLAFPGMGKSFFVNHTDFAALEFPEISFGKNNIKTLNQTSLINNFYSELFQQFPNLVYLLGPADQYHYILAKSFTKDIIYVFLPENTKEAKDAYYSRYIKRSPVEQAKLGMQSWDKVHNFWQNIDDPQFKIIYTKPTEYLTDYLDPETGKFKKPELLRF